MTDPAALLYPLGLACVLLLVVLLIGFGFSYLGLLAFDAQVRTCPHCHKRGAGKILSTEVLDTRSQTTWDHKRGFSGRSRQFEITEEKYADHYECQRCGHRWTRTGRETTRTPVSQ